MKKVLIITYYWPPAGGPGVQRVLKFAKYLSQFGWQPIILTVKNGEYPAIDRTLEREIPEECIVYKTNSLEPNQIYKRFIGINQTKSLPVAVLTEEDLTFKKKFANWVRINLFIPDAKIGWRFFAVKKGKKIIEQYKPDIIFSSSPPPTVHLIAKRLAKLSGIKWVADFRDPWTNIYHYDKINKSYHQKILDKQLEQSVVKHCDKVVTVGDNVRKLLDDKDLYIQKTYIISNGFDKEEIDRIGNPDKFKKFTIAYAGKMNNQQNPLNLWKACRTLINSDTNFAKNIKILLIGNISNEVKIEISKFKIDNIIKYTGYINHNEALLYLKRSHLLLFTIVNTKQNKGLFSAKLFEYIALKNYILGIGPKDGEAKKILEETKSGQMFDYSDDISNFLLSYYNSWKNNLHIISDDKKIQQYSREELTKKLINIFDTC